MDSELISPPVELLRVLAEPLRWRIVVSLAREELCVCHLTEELVVAQPLVSHHLRVLGSRAGGDATPPVLDLLPAPPPGAGRSRRAARRARHGLSSSRPPPAAVLLMRSLPRPELARRAVAEFVGTALLVAVVVGSGIAAARLSPGDTGLQLLENAAATAAGLAAIIFAVGSVSGAHLNPMVTMGCGDARPLIPGRRYEDWELDDPAGLGVDAVRPIRDEIEKRIRTLLGECPSPSTTEGQAAGERRTVCEHFPPRMATC